MKKLIIVSLFFLSISGKTYAAMEDDPTLTKFMLNEFEASDGADNPLSWNAQMWIGKDLNKLWIKTEGEQEDGRTEESEVQLLYSKAIAPYWDVQIGIRQDSVNQVDRDWAVVGLEGLAPYFFEIDTALFIGESGQAGIRLEAEYELMLTQKLVLSPEVEANFYAKDDVERETGSGLSNLETGVRLRYEIKREFAPYIGVTWNKLLGETADIAETADNETDSSSFVIGLRAWF